MRHHLIVALIWLLAACGQRAATPPPSPTPPPPSPTPTEVPPPPASPTPLSLAEKYREIGLIDVHNHDAAGGQYVNSLALWERYHLSRVVLFGAISDPAAVTTDATAWEAYRQHPDRIYPFFSGFNMHTAEGVETVRQRLEQGFFGLGEVVAASTYSPIASRVAWKGAHPMDGKLPEIYELCARYAAPILLHIDPPTGQPIARLEEALATHPDTVIIFGHANAYNSPANIERLLARHPNLYIDFFAGFTAYNPESTNTLADFVPLMTKYSDRFLLSSDSGYGISPVQAYEAMYQMLDLLDPETARRVAHDNFERLIAAQPATERQRARVQELAAALGESVASEGLTKRAANELIFSMERRLPPGK